MKAAFFTRPGGPDVLEIGEVPDPEPNAGELLVRVSACGVNALDAWARANAEPSGQRVVGSEIVGFLESGERTGLHVGDEVVVNPAIPCGKCRRCVVGDPCEVVDIVGWDTPGGYAEFVAVPASQVYPKPPRLSLEESAAFPLTYLTAWHMLSTRARVQPGETVFVWGAAGNLGSAGVAVAEHLGARVIAAARTDEAANRLLASGATETVLYEREDVVARVKELTAGDGADVVFEGVGAATWERTLSMLGFGGRVVIAGTASGDVASQDLSDVYYYQQTILGARMGTTDEFEALLSALTSGGLRPPLIDSVVPLADAKGAHQRMESRQHIGKIVLRVES